MMKSENLSKFWLFIENFKNIDGVSEWLLFNANLAIFQLYHDENK